MGEIERQARLIAGLADTMNDRLWSDDILTRCGQIEEAVRLIRQQAQRKRGGDR